MSFPADPNTSILFDLLMQDGRYGGLLIGADNCILGVMGAAARLLGRDADALLKQTLDRIGRPLYRSEEPAETLGTFVPCGPGEEAHTLRCQKLAAAEPGQWLLVLRADPPHPVAESAPPWPAADAFFQYLNQSAHVALWISDPALKHIHYLSPGARKLWGPGWDRSASPDIWRDATLAEDMPRLEAFIQTQMSGKAAEVEVRIRRWIWAHSCPWIYTRGEPRVTGVITDVTEARSGLRMERRSELRTTGAPQHWDALLREGHHRVKNSLQGLAALLHRHAGTRGEHREILIEAVGQVRAIAAVHELLSREGQTAARLGELLKNLVDSVEGLYPNHPPIERAWAAPADMTPIPSSQILPLTIIINELLTNAVKHGRPGPAATIRIHLYKDGEAVALAIDNPGHVPPGFDFARKRGLGTGLQLIAALLDPPNTELEIHPLTHETLRATLRFTAPHVP
jgi:two-component sensor histidine kinase